MIRTSSAPTTAKRRAGDPDASRIAGFPSIGIAHVLDTILLGTSGLVEAVESGNAADEASAQARWKGVREG